MKRPTPRSLAIEILNRVEDGKAFAEPLLDQYLATDLLEDTRDRGLLTELVYGTLRMRGFVDWVLAQFLQKDLTANDTGLRNILRTALYQIFFTDKIPDHAIVNEAVELTKSADPGKVTLTNAILRNVLRRKEELPFPERRQDFRSYLTVLHSHPTWLVDRWVRQLGEEEALSLCQANNTVAPMVLRANKLQTSRERVMEAMSREGIKVEKTAYAPDGIIVREAGKSLRDTVAYRQGLFQVQDEASQMIARLVNPAAGETILDLCAGMGGKATHLAEIMENQGRIVAIDLRKSKLRQLQDLAKRLSVRIIEPVAADATADLDMVHKSCDRVLVDVPCSGLGTLRRCPEIKWRLTPEILQSNTRLQKKLLERAGNYVKPGGRLVYSTCSIMPEENEDIVASFLATHPEFLPVFPTGVDRLFLDDQGYFRTFPHRHGTDGFFGAVMEKSG
ncbi:MAG: 16S rRNA (cytosine(967)-C(5))-methyltransferase RsmB [Syntrophus sp. (in: bacteria)]